MNVRFNTETKHRIYKLAHRIHFNNLYYTGCISYVQDVLPQTNSRTTDEIAVT